MKKPIKTNYTPEQIMYVGSHSKEITEGYNDAAKRFFEGILPIVYVAYEEVLDVIDELDNRKMRFGNWTKPIVREGEMLESFISKIGNSVAPMLYDYFVQLRKLLSHDISSMRATAILWFRQNNYADPEIKGRCQVAYAMLDFAVSFYNKFFEFLRDQYILDFRPDFRWADLSESLRLLGNICDSVCSAKKRPLKISESYALQKEIERYSDHITSQEYCNKAGLQALRWNGFEADAKRFEQKEMGIDKLGEKFKLTKNEKNKS